MDSVDLIFVMVILSILALLIWLGISIAKKESKKRSKELKEMALKSGYSYSENVDLKLDDIDIAWLIGSGKCRNMLKIVRQDIVWRIFDYTSGSGKNTRAQTAFMAEAARSFPKFILSEKSFFDKLLISRLFGLNEMKFDNHHQFSKQYLLLGYDEISVRNVFDQKVISHFETCKLDGTIKANMNMIYYYKLNKLLKPEDLASKFDEVTAILSVFLI